MSKPNTATRPETAYTPFDEFEAGDQVNFLTWHKTADGASYHDAHNGEVVKVTAKALYIDGTGRDAGKKFRIFDSQMDSRQVIKLQADTGQPADTDEADTTDVPGADTPDTDPNATVDARLAADAAALADKLRTRGGKKDQAQEMLMHGIATVLGYWTEHNTLVVDALGNDEAIAEFGEVLKREADRIAKLMRFNEAWIA